ncbi:MAG: N-acetylmuramoyl-L-alanine amidase [Bacteroidetes bacterium]|jgi:N-acetylmuramoyl-L-alanine amidase|nr:N-acetylmuramoyl-L-alanine amidase [Bacteroidota bacterium]
MRRLSPAYLLLGCLAAAMLLPSPALFAQRNTMRMEFETDPSKNTIIGTFMREGIQYCSLTDLLQALEIRTSESTEKQKLHFAFGTYSVKVTRGNAFLVVTDQKRQSIYQLPLGVVYAAGSYFVPLKSFLHFFNNIHRPALTFNGSYLLVGTAPATPQFDISTIVLEPKSNGMLIRIPVSRQMKDLESWMRNDGWFYVTIPDARADTVAVGRTKPVGLVRKVVAIQSPMSVQLTFKLSSAISSTELIQNPVSNDIVITIRTKGGEERMIEERKREELRAGLDVQRDRWYLDAIVIDPGHGGKDWGATGVSGVREKDVTLGIGLKLGKLIKKGMSDVRVIHTRSDDRFIELDRRGQIANEADGKLFISIHCNSLKRKPNPTRGFEVYLLRPGRTEEAIAIAERENAVIELEEGYEKRYQQLTEENFILVTMAQSAHAKASEIFADITQREMEARTGIPNRGVRQAGFYVLVGAAMPNVLVESAYLSNREDERFLKSESGQQKIAEALYRAIKGYKEEYEKLLMEGRELGLKIDN